MPVLPPALAQMTRLRSLDLSRMLWVAIFELQKKSLTRHTHNADNGIADLGAMALAEALAAHPSLLVLRLIGTFVVKIMLHLRMFLISPTDRTPQRMRLSMQGPPLLQK